MVMGELTTARDLNLPVIVIVFPDASLAPIEMKQRAVTYADTAVDFPGTDYTKVARALSGKQLCLLQPGTAQKRSHAGTDDGMVQRVILRVSRLRLRRPNLRGHCLLSEPS